MIVSTSNHVVANDIILSFLRLSNLHNPDNHNGVITHLEPDILECEVKWALGSITTNKASGGDGIPVELFQILEEDAVKVLHAICQQIWKTYLFNLYAEYLMRKAVLEEAQAGIKIAERNINNLWYEADSTLTAESENKLESLDKNERGEWKKLA